MDHLILGHESLAEVVEAGAELWPGVVLRGATRIAAGARIVGAVNTVLFRDGAMLRFTGQEDAWMTRNAPGV